MPALDAWQPGHRTSNLLRSAGGLLLVSALISGLLNFPSTCDCGAEMPHPHSLFLLADHHHHLDGSVENVGHAHGGPAMQQAKIALRGLVAQASTPEGVSGEQISLTIEAFGMAAWSGTSEPLAWPLQSSLTRIGEPPEPPPPRSPVIA